MSIYHVKNVSSEGEEGLPLDTLIDDYDRLLTVLVNLNNTNLSLNIEALTDPNAITVPPVDVVSDRGVIQMRNWRSSLRLNDYYD